MTGLVHHPSGPRAYVAGCRLHHGTAGLAALAVAVATRRRELALIGLVALWHDRADFPFRDCDNH